MEKPKFDVTNTVLTSNVHVREVYEERRNFYGSRISGKCAKSRDETNGEKSTK